MTLVGAQVAHDAAVAGGNATSTYEALATAWNTAYGPERDRWPIDVEWRFAEQFVTHREVLDPATWTFVLHVDDRLEYDPVGTTVLKSEKIAVEHYWEGAIRLWFPWKDYRRDRVLLAGATRFVRLEIKHPSGNANVTWRFRTSF